MGSTYSQLLRCMNLYFHHCIALYGQMLIINHAPRTRVHNLHSTPKFIHDAENAPHTKLLYQTQSSPTSHITPPPPPNTENGSARSRLLRPPRRNVHHHQIRPLQRSAIRPPPPAPPQPDRNTTLPSPHIPGRNPAYNARHFRARDAYRRGLRSTRRLYVQKSTSEWKKTTGV